MLAASGSSGASGEQSQNVYENKGEGQKVRFQGIRKLCRCRPHPARLVLRGKKARMFMKTKKKVKKSRNWVGEKPGGEYLPERAMFVVRFGI